MIKLFQRTFYCRIFYCFSFESQGQSVKKNAKRPAKDKSGTHTRMTTEESINLAVQVSLQEVNLPSPVMNTECFFYCFP
jgi:hypothetical protein